MLSVLLELILQAEGQALPGAGIEIDLALVNQYFAAPDVEQLVEFVPEIQPAASFIFLR